MATRDLQAAKEAYASLDPSLSKKAHDANATKKNLNTPAFTLLAPTIENHRSFTEFEKHRYMKTLVVTMLHSIATTTTILSILSAGFNCSTKLTLLIAVSLLLALAIHISYSEYSNLQANLDFAIAEKRREQWELDNYPEGEIQEMVELYMSRGFSQQDAETIMSYLVKNPAFFVDHMMVTELGVLPPESNVAPACVGLVNLASFIVAGAFNLIPYAVYASFPSWASIASHHDVNVPYILSASIAVVSSVVLGVVQGHLANLSKVKCAVHAFLRICLPCVAGFLLGYFLSRAFDMNALA